MMTARQILETRLGRALGPVGEMPKDLRDAMRLLARELVWKQHGSPRKHPRRKVTRR